MQSAATHNSSGPNAARRRKKRLVVGISGVLLLVIAGVAAFGFSRSLNAGDRSGGTPDLHRVKHESFEIIVTASGELEAENQTEIRSQLESPADIVEIIDEGRRVKKGELLVKLNDETIRRNIEDQLLTVEAARNDLVAAENALAIQINENDAARRQAQLKVELASIDLKKWEEGEVAKRRLELESALDSAIRNFERLDEKLKQSKALFERDFLSYDELRRDEISYFEAEAAVERAKMDIKVYEEYEYARDRKQKTSDLEEAQAELERVLKQNESRVASKRADLSNRQRQLALREERLKALEEQLRAATLTAPTGGLVVYGTSIGNNRGFSFSSGDGPLQIGRTVRPNELLIVLPDTSSMVASVRVHESVAGRIHAGQRAVVRVDAIRDRTYSGVVKSVGVLAESGGWRDPNLREYTVKILLEGGNAEQKLKPSMRADAEIILGDVENTIAVPVQSIFHQGQVSYVYVPRGGKYEKVPVRPGRRSSTLVEIVKGLESGQSVLLREPAPGEVLSREISPQAIAAIQPTQAEIQAQLAAAKAEADALKAAAEPEIDVAAIRNNPNLPQEARDRMKDMTDDQIRDMAKRFAQRGQRPQGAQSGQGGAISAPQRAANN